MTQVTDAIFTNGVFKPLEPLQLRESQRVRLTVQTLDFPTDAEREEALKRFREHAEKMNFRSTGPYPTRDELHERR